MSGIKKTVLFLTAVCLVAVLASALISCAPEEEAEVGKYGGIVRIAYGSAPPSLDVHRHFNTATQDIARHIFEPLFEYDSNYEPRPALANSWTVSDDSLTFTIELMEGVLFHDGSEMTAEDVVASIYRYFSVFPIPTALGARTESIEAVGDYTVEYRLKTPFPNFIESLTSSSIVIMPKEIVEEYFVRPNDILPDDKIIGTGAYKLKTHAQGRFVHLERFEEYVGRDEEPDGYFGKKYAYVDELHFEIVVDPSVRLLGVEGGEYHYAHGVNFEEHSRVLDNPDLQALIISPSTMIGSLLNCAQGPTANIKIRQAMQAAIDVEPILKAAFFYPVFFELNSGAHSIVSRWHTNVGAEYYNQADPEKAKRLLEEAGYKGEPIIMIGVSDFEYLRILNMVVAEQLKQAGFNIDLQLVEQGTFVARLMDPGAWNIASSVSMFTPVLGLENLRVNDIAGWNGEDPEQKLALETKVLGEMDFDRRFAYWEEYQMLIKKEVPMIRIGEGKSFAVATVNTTGWTTNMHGPRFNNVYFIER